MQELRNAILLTHLGDLEVGCFSTYKAHSTPVAIEQCDANSRCGAPRQDIVIPPYVSDPRFLAAEGGKDLNVPGKHKVRPHSLAALTAAHLP